MKSRWKAAHQIIQIIDINTASEAQELASLCGSEDIYNSIKVNPPSELID
jgi:hypothetical protein